MVAYDSTCSKLVVHVVDTGKGINNREMSKLFKMFAKISRTQGLNTEGIGIGLMICKRIIENSGGEITVCSAGEDKGSTFKFTM